MASGLSRTSVSRSISLGLHAPAEATNGKAAMVSRPVDYDEDDVAVSAARYDVFINHRGADTKRNVARLLYDRLQQLTGGGVRSFLDNMSMRPGDRLEERLDAAIRECRVGVAIFSPRYFESDFCLRELAALVEARKIIIPIFYDIKPSDLLLPEAVVESNAHGPGDVERFRRALREVKYTVGLVYDSATGDLAELVSVAANAVLQRIEEQMRSAQSRQMIVSRL
ncbi:hypothetical protein ACP70R_004561 [Stipagrostis hirtigluma subsp. patula]